MTQTHRLALNTVVSYIRSLLALFLGLFSSRWVLQALGQVDYGLYGVVGSLITSIGFLNITMSGSVSRFYAFTIGKSVNIGDTAFRNEMKELFDAAMCMHVSVALLMLLLGWPIGEYVIRYVLSIPQDRIATCLWVLRLSIFSSICSVVSVPYVALYTAYQYIAELTIFDIVRTILNFISAAFLVNISGADNLLLYSIMMACLSIGVTIVQLWRAKFHFPLKFNIKNIAINLVRVREVGIYVGFKIMGVLGWLIKTHGNAFVINLSFGPTANAAYSIANQVLAHSTSLASSLMNAIAPALTTSAGSNDRDRMKKYAISACKFSGLLVLLFAVPILCEMDYILKLWLKTPPAESNRLSLLFIIAFFVDIISIGYVMAICSFKKIGKWQTIEFIILSLTAPLTYILYKLSFSLQAIGFVFLACSFCIACERVYFGFRLIGINPIIWVKEVLVRLLIVLMVGGGLGLFVRKIFSGMRNAELGAIAITVVLVMILSWFFGLNFSERKLLQANFMGIWRKFKR